MAFTTFGVIGFAETPDGSAVTLQSVLEYAQEKYHDDDGKAPVVLLFDTGEAKLGTVHQGEVFQITAGPNTGCYAIVSPIYFPDKRAQLPNIKDAGDGMAANWMLQSNVGGELGRTYGPGSSYIIPLEMKDRALVDNYIVFYATLVPNEQTSTITKIMGIFYKVIKVLLGEELADKFLNLLSELGLVVEI